MRAGRLRRRAAPGRGPTHLEEGRTQVRLGVARGFAGQYAAHFILVVGVYFIPLGRPFRIEALVWAGLALIPVAAAAAVTGAATGIQPGTARVREP